MFSQSRTAYQLIHITAMDEQIQGKKKRWYFRWWMFPIYFVLVIIIVASASDAKDKAQTQMAQKAEQEETAQKEEPAAQAENKSSPVAEKVEANPKTDQQKLEEQMSKTVADATGDFSYRKLDVEEADADRPAGSKMLTATVSVASIYNKNSFLRYSGQLSSELFKQAFASNLNAYDVFVWYRAETTDRYGNKEDSVITVYSIDKETYNKINWNSFDSDKLCDFLQQEEKIGGIGSGPACNVLANIQ